jgi:PAS domain S-box-containing protein
LLAKLPTVRRSNTRGKNGSGTILVVDDDPGTRETISDAVRLQGYTVETATSGRPVLKRVTARRFDAAIVDVKLPDISGLEVLEGIKAVSPQTEVIFLTAYASLPTALQAIEGAAFAYLTKPFEMEHLLAKLAKARERQHLAEALRQSEERYRLITENLIDAVFLLDLDGRVVFANSRALALTGYEAAELGGRSIISLLARDGREKALALMTHGRPGRPIPPSFEARLLTKGGGEVWVEANIANVMKDRQAVGRLAVARDITDRKRGAEVTTTLYETLTKREREVLFLAAEGHTNSRIARLLTIGVRTVESHRANLMRKLALRNQSELVRYAVQRGLLPLDIRRP